jgi:hypothetical protein
VLHDAGRGWKEHIGRDRADDDDIDVGWSQAALSKRFPGSLDCKVAGGNTLFDDVTFADTDSRENPVIGSVNHFLEVSVRKKPGGHVGAKSTDLHSDRDRCIQ